ncbi:hypothetical protein [Jiangella mangrovi]|uniref:Uncharacterized protein n=1 Tax=Jiangella mangrovi TaxID=1524084 RepID=A0A7W9GQW5_9ACTN|nr:hypothetical protein [Jiangella mangrovi]MBB5788373.1 hypothetical protein [Jiangella mangrovi]
MTATSSDHPAYSAGPAASVAELFRDVPVVTSADDLAQDGVFDDGEVELFLAHLATMRRAGFA